MSTKRHLKIDRKDDRPRGPNGRYPCRYCDVEVPRGRRTFCSDKCVHEWKIRSNAAYARGAVFDRDKGVCIACGVDTVALKAELNRLRYENRTAWFDRIDSLGITWPSHLWEADHIIEVVRGGGSCGLDNLQTLCTACHKRKTARLAAERAAERRALKGTR